MNTSPTVQQYIGQFLILYLWVFFWKGLALWHASKHKQKKWFIAMIVTYSFTAGLLELTYLFFFSKPKFNFKSLLFWKKKDTE